MMSSELQAAQTGVARAARLAIFSSTGCCRSGDARSGVTRSCTISNGFISLTRRSMVYIHLLRVEIRFLQTSESARPFHCKIAQSPGFNFVIFERIRASRRLKKAAGVDVSQHVWRTGGLRFEAFPQKPGETRMSDFITLANGGGACLPRVRATFTRPHPEEPRSGVSKDD